jgi:HSP20 family molecular chaperone IbpA
VDYHLSVADGELTKKGEIMFNVVNFDRTFKSMFDDLSAGFSTDVRENESYFEILADLPGVDKKDIDISIENRILTISAKRGKQEGKILAEGRWFGENKVSYRLGFPVDEKDISAELSLGVLKLKIPKAKSSIKKIEIN